jgi:hypothetical protein
MYIYINSEYILMAHIIPIRWEIGPHGTDSKPRFFFKLHTARLVQGQLARWQTNHRKRPANCEATARSID